MKVMLAAGKLALIFPDSGLGTPSAISRKGWQIEVTVDDRTDGVIQVYREGIIGGRRPDKRFQYTRRIKNTFVRKGSDARFQHTRRV